MRIGSQPELEHLFRHLLSPLVALMLFGKFESEFLIKMTGRIESRECPKINSVEICFPTKFDGLCHQHLTNPLALVFRRHDEPSQMGTVAIEIHPVNGNGPGDSSIYTHYTESIPGFVESAEKLRKLDSHLGFEIQIETPMLVVIPSMKFSNPTDRPGDIPGPHS